MNPIASLFGDYTGSEQYQKFVDLAQARFNVPFYTRFFRMAPPSDSLQFTTIIGRARVEAAASIMALGAAKPLRGRAGMEKLQGEVIPMGQKFILREEELRAYLSAMNNTLYSNDALKQRQMQLVWDDTEKAANSISKRVDYIALQMLSEGYAYMGDAGNPDGPQLYIPLGGPADQKRGAYASWDSPEADPLKDIEDVVAYMEAKGRTIGQILMPKRMFSKFKRIPAVQNALKFYYNPGSTPIFTLTVDALNTYLDANLLPQIVLIDEKVGVESDGIISTQRPFNENNLVFIPSGELGVIHNARPIEMIRPVQGVSYATVNGALLSKYATNAPLQEHTDVEAIMCPSLEAIDSIFILRTDQTEGELTPMETPTVMGFNARSAPRSVTPATGAGNPYIAAELEATKADLAAEKADKADLEALVVSLSEQKAAPSAADSKAPKSK